MQYRFVFVHGWGMPPSFWDSLIDCLPEIKAIKINLGFIGEEREFSEQSFQPSIYITHSLGTVWALKNRYPAIKALISINGFGCFKNFICARTLLAMKARLKRNPVPQMGEFWEMCGIPGGNDHSLNLDKLQKGLEWLASWDAGKELKFLGHPVLSLAGREDLILPVDTMKQEWDSFEMHIRKGGGHALPLTDPEWCVEKIKDFLRDNAMG